MMKEDFKADTFSSILYHVFEITWTISLRNLIINKKMLIRAFAQNEGWIIRTVYALAVALSLSQFRRFLYHSRDKFMLRYEQNSNFVKSHLFSCTITNYFMHPLCWPLFKIGNWLELVYLWNEAPSVRSLAAVASG